MPELPKLHTNEGEKIYDTLELLNHRCQSLPIQDLERIFKASTDVLLHVQKMEHENKTLKHESKILKQKNSQLQWQLKYNVHKAKSESVPSSNNGSESVPSSNNGSESVPSSNNGTTSGYGSDKLKTSNNGITSGYGSDKLKTSNNGTTSGYGSDKLKTSNNGSTSELASETKEGGDEDWLDWTDEIDNLIELPLTEAPKGGEGAGTYGEDKNKGNKVNNTESKRKIDRHSKAKKKSKRDSGN